MDNLENYQDSIIQLLIDYAPKLAVAIVILIVGFYLIGFFTRSLKKLMKKREVDPTLVPFLSNIFSITLKIMLLISVASMVGIETTSFVAVIGAAGLAVGLALQGSLSNFAGGVLIILFRPYRVGDFIEAQGQGGTVHAIQILYTVLKSPDNKTIVIPNSSVMGGTITNYSIEDNRRLDLVFGVSYSDDIKKVKDLLTQMAMDDERVIKDPAPFIAIKEMADSSVNFLFRVWVKKEDYWPMTFDMQELVKTTFDKEGISIPFPQRDVHLFQQK
jgi:small conductance mechanosensitive channel